MPLNFEEVLKGINLIWNNKFDEADAIFKTQCKTSPRYALHYAEGIFLRSFITADSEDTLSAVNRLRDAKTIAEQHIKAYEKGHKPGDPTAIISDKNELLNLLLDSRIVLGDALYLTAILQVTRDSKIKGVFNLRKSWKVFEKALKDSKNIQNLDQELSRMLHFGAGFFLFAMSIIPQKFLRLVEFVGFKADRDAGLHYIRECHKNAGIRAPFATILLLFNNLLLPRGLANAEKYLKEADELIQEALKQYPTGSLFHVMGSHCARKQCNIEKGIKLMEEALENSKHFSQPPLIYRYELANCHAMKLDWEKSVSMFLPLLEEKKFQVRAICGIQLASCYMMLGQKDKAAQYFSKVPQLAGSSKSGFDTIVTKQSKRYLANGGYFSAFELLYLRRDLAKMTPVMAEVIKALDDIAVNTKALEKKQLPQQAKKGKLESALGGSIGGLGKKLTSFTKKPAQLDYSFDDRAAYLLLKGSMVKSLGKNDEAIEMYKEAIEMSDFLVEKLYAPYCLYELGECYYIKGQFKEAEEMFKRCGKYSGYEWEDPLRVRLRVTMDQLKKGLNPEEKIITLDSLANSNSIDDKDDSDDKEPEDEDEEKLQKKLAEEEED